MQVLFHFCAGIGYNVRRYVALAQSRGGACFCTRGAVCRIMQLLLYSRVGKNRDTKRGSPAGAGAGRTADHLTVLLSQKILAVRKSQ
jgi:hypothetical protein